jgi:hypothetical protein
VPSPLDVRRPIALQPKLAVGAVDDPLEHEAERVADHVMRMPSSAFPITPDAAQISRKCDVCEEETATLRTKGAAASEAPNIFHRVLNSPGQPLDPATRASFEGRFGYDFNNVRVHNDAVAQASARTINALAYTVGPHIAFQHG